jgi:hypothetical protein
MAIIPGRAVGTHAKIAPFTKNPPYDAVTDFTPVGLLLDSQCLLTQGPAGHHLQEFAAYTKIHQKIMNTAPAAPGPPIIAALDFQHGTGR